MNTMKWLIRREFWEHKGMLLWAPLAAAALVALLAGTALLLGHNFTYEVNGVGGPIGDVIVEGHARTGMAAAMTRHYMAAALPLFMMLGVLVFFYCLGALHDERRDRSILFWKSLPISDRATVLSKVALALVVAPLIVIAIGTVESLLLLLAACGMLLLHGSNLFGEVLATPDLYLAPLRVLSLLPVYMLWALPTVGWLLMVSSMARSKVFLWAVGGPLLAAMLMGWADKVLRLGVDSSWFLHTIVARILLGVAPGSWVLFTNLEDRQAMQGEGLLASSWATLGQPGLWVGVAAGVAMIAVAIWMRRRREEG
ncbi:hypothetical protein H3H37_01890 [Duganella sp. LX20W]|uniref:ABC-2 type transport system permease protein n=1 Tax=Rugamonas brunnea TaxID=2758569 RepID=A0A7W2IA27_9BURK|nr:hypothetical protein [Rugamonas brunnea]MBA5635804.1 hypothetical protein [Rugamonas brunnea]